MIIYIIILILIISIGSFFFPFLFGRFIGLNGVKVLISIFYFICVCLTSLLLYLHINLGQVISIKLIKWIKIELVSIDFGIFVDPLSVLMLFVISIISMCANIYSIEYMQNDPHIIRYFAYLSLFTFFMLLLVTSENLIQLFIGWEGVGICSYILINFWYCRMQANKASILAIVANKIGDIALLISSALIYYVFKSNSFYVINNILFLLKEYLYYELVYIKILKFINLDLKNYILFNFNEIFSINNLLEFSMLLFIIACVGKSAQFGFHFWLPEAMEGPTPVSSLIHAATMVTAGIFLILRMSNLLILTNYSNTYILIIGSITLFFAATIGLVQVDIKKIIAYSTCSQLGYMFLSCGFYGFNNSFFHLFIHAFFKALLFLSSGYIIHLLCDEQDIRKFGGILKIAPLSYNFILIGSAALIGFPFMSGWYSKEALIEFILNKSFNSLNIYIVMFNNFALILAFLTVVVTLLYSIKSIYQIYFGIFTGYKYYIKNLHYNNFYINIPLLILSILSIYCGYFFNDLFIGINASYLGLTLNIKTHLYNLIAEYYPYYRFFIIILLFYFSILYLYIKKYYYNFFFILTKNNLNFYNLYYTVSKKYLYINRFLLYNNIRYVFKFSYNITYKIIDKGFLEIFGPYGITYIINNLTLKTNKMQTGYIYHYIGYIFITLIIFIFIVLYLL